MVNERMYIRDMLRRWLFQAYVQCKHLHTHWGEIHVGINCERESEWAEDRS